MSVIIAALASTACLPPAQDAGEAESTGVGDGGLGSSDTHEDTDEATRGSEGTDGGATGTVPADPSVDWSLELDSTVSIHRMIRSPAGVVAVLQGEDSAELVEVSAGMEIWWSRDLFDSWVADIEALGGGTYVLAGHNVMVDVPVATAWRMSSGDPGYTVSSPLGAAMPGAFVVLEPHGDGFFVAFDDGSPTAGFMRLTGDLTIPTELEPQGFRVLDGEVTSMGNVLLQASEGGGADLLYEVAVDGTGSGYGPGQRTMLVGEGEDLTLLTFGNEQLGIQAYDGGAVVPVAVPGLSLESFAVDRRERFAFAFRMEEAGGSTVHVTEFDETGAVLRELVLPSLYHDQASPTALAVGADDAIYVAVAEDDGAGANATVLHRIAPL